MNILLIVIDCLRADHVYESKAHIPHMTKLKNKGYSFLNTIVSACSTTPSFASLLTGLYPFENGVRCHSGYSLKNDVVTFTEILKENGYNTYAEVTGPLATEVGLSKGFDEYNYRGRRETIFNSKKDLIDKFKRHYKEPWFVLLHIWTLHEPRMVIKECAHKNYGLTIYARALASIDKYLGKLLANINDNTLIIITGDHGEQISRSKVDLLLKRKFEEIFLKLKKRRIMNIPISKGTRKFHIGHGNSIYDVLVKVPLIFYNEDVVPAGSSACQIRQIDIFPTIMDLINIKHNIKTTGESALPIMKGHMNTHRDAYIEEAGTVLPNKDEWLVGLRINNMYKYIFFPFRQDVKEELYYLKNDPKEKRNIAEYHKSLTKKFKKKIEKMEIEDLVGEKIEKEEQKKILKRLKALGYVD